MQHVFGVQDWLGPAGLESLRTHICECIALYIPNKIEHPGGYLCVACLREAAWMNLGGSWEASTNTYETSKMPEVMGCNCGKCDWCWKYKTGRHKGSLGLKAGWARWNREQHEHINMVMLHSPKIDGGTRIDI